MEHCFVFIVVVPALPVVAVDVTAVVCVILVLYNMA